MAGIRLARLDESGAHPHSSYTEFLRELVAKLVSTLGVVVHADKKTKAVVIKT